MLCTLFALCAPLGALADAAEPYTDAQGHVYTPYRRRTDRSGRGRTLDEQLLL